MCTQASSPPHRRRRKRVGVDDKRRPQGAARSGWAVEEWEAEHGRLSEAELAEARKRVAEEFRKLARKPA